MRAELSTKSKKSLTYSLFIVLVLSIFLLGYFFYFIPRNKSTINNNGFLILKTIADNIQEKSKGRLAYYKNISLKSNQEDTAVQEVLKQNSINTNSSSRLNTGNNFQNLDSIEGIVGIEDGSFLYKINSGSKDTLSFKENISEFLQSILATQKEELFENYALAKVNGKGPQLLFHDEGFGVRFDVKLDSLLPKNVQAYLTGIRDINSADFKHKMFYYPFKVDTFQLVLCGFVKSGEYNAAMRKVPFSFVYPLAIAFLLLISFLPILKFYLMDSNEQIRVKDIFLFGLSVFFGAAMVTLVIIQYLLRRGEQDRVSQHLKNISAQIENNFYKELNAAYNHMGFLDSLRKMDTVIQVEIEVKKNVDYSKQIRNYLQLMPGKNAYPFDRISWIDSSGMQVLKAEVSGQPVFTNVKNRAYYKAIESGHSYSLVDDFGNSKRFGFEPIYSWTNGDFNISMSKQGQDYIVAMAGKMTSVVDVLLPTGYKFCIIDDKGNVLLHADRNRNLRENLYEKTTPADKIRRAVAARQQVDIGDVTMYNNQRHIMHVSPLKGLPYSIVTFYDKAFIAPVNLRILIFALIFFVISASLCLLLWGVLARGGLTKHRLLYCPMDCMLWLSPQKREAAYYAHGVLFLSIYLLLFIVFIALHRSFIITNYTIFSLVLFTPLNIVAVLFSIRAGLTLNQNQYQEQEQQKVQRKTVWIALMHLLFSIVFFSASLYADFAIGVAFLLFQVLFSIWIWYYRYYKPQTPAIFKLLSTHHKMGYSIIATYLVICLSVLPCGLYTWYAHNQEFIQSVKKQQLHFAKSLDERMNVVLTNPVLSDTIIISEQTTNELIFSKGFYKIYSDTASLQPGTLYEGNGKYKDVSFESLYFTIADNLLDSYNDPQTYPSLQNYSGDSSWRWQVSTSEINFYYTLHTQPAGARQVLHIKSILPSRFMFLKGFALLWLLPFIALLVYALYKWLRLNTDYVFLIKYSDTFKVDTESKIKLLIEEFKSQQPISDPTSADKIFSPHDYNKYTINTTPDDLHSYEKEVLEVAASGKNFYEFVWSKCTEKEKYLLFDFALDGLINYKNTTEIYALLGKGILIIHNEKMRLFNPAFRAHLITKSDTDEVIQLHKKYHQNSSWQAIKKPLLILLLGGAVLIFFTQEAMFQKVLAVAGGLGTLISLIPKIFSGIGNKAPEGQ